MDNPMATTQKEKLEKVRILYERTTNIGEKAAAYEALKRLGKSNETSSLNWQEEIKDFLVGRGFYLALWIGNSQLYSRVSEKVWITKTPQAKGNWSYFKAYSGKKFVFTDRKPDSVGTNLEQLKKIIK